MPRRQLPLLACLLLAGCAAPAPQLANPASVHCARAGGRLVIERNAAGGAFGVCHFEDNRQCEEWALFRGHCPAGGLKVTGYLTPAARYCAIRGGLYRTTSPGAETRPEQGDCTLPDGRMCGAGDYFSGECPP